MKKNTIKAFTLVEMLIVIVIIGILIAALMPRMQAAQWRARDVSRKTALSQVQSAIVVYQWDHWEWPLEKVGDVYCTEADIADESNTTCHGKTTETVKESGKSATNWIGISSISTQLKEAWMSSIPYDPLKSKVTWLWAYEGSDDGDYGYIVATRNWTPNWWFALMAKTEVVWGSNRVVCSGDSNNGKISNSTDLSTDVVMCSDIKEGECSNDMKGNCKYKNDSELRYLVIY